jgi:hypothetical protein
MGLVYQERRCNCGHRFCSKWQVAGLAPEAHFDTETAARAVADVLNFIAADPNRVPGRFVDLSSSWECT